MKLHVAIVAVIFLGIFQVASSDVHSPTAPQTNLFEERCRKHGGPYAFANFRNIPQQFRNCLVLKTNLDLTDQQISTAPSMIRLVTDLCLKRRELDACVYNSAETAQACFDAEDQKSINTSVNIITGASDYLCKNNAEEFLAFSTSATFGCFLQNIGNISECFEVLNTRKTEIPPGDTGMDSSLQKLIKFLKFDADECRNLDKTEQCVAKEMEKCKSYPNSDFVNKLIAAAKEETACSGSARGSTIPSVLMFVVTLTLAYLPFA